MKVFTGGGLFMRVFHQTLAFLIVMTIGAANAATITVTSESDGPQQVDGLCTLREAIETANFVDPEVSLLNGCDRIGTGTDTIVFAPDMSFISVTAGEMVITDELIIDGTIDASGQAANIVIDGDDDSRIFSVTAEANHLTLNNLRLENGNANNADGGAIYSEARLTINNTRFASNEAGGNGGAIYMATIQLTMPLTINQGYFYNNSVNGDTSKGGAIFALRNVEVNSSTFSTNQSSHQAGAIYADRGLLNIKDSHFEMNSSVHDGGAIRSLFAKTEVQNSAFIDNTANNGGALFSGVSINISRSTFFRNHASFWGGAIATANLADVAITSSTLAKNQANNRGAAVYSSNDISITNSTLTDNLVPANVETILFANNNIKLESNILLGNSLPNCNGTTIEGSHNLLDDLSCGAGGTIRTEAQGIGIINARLIDVLVNDGTNATLADNGCVTKAGAEGAAACVKTVLLKESATDAIDQGSALTNDAVTGEPITSDQRQLNFLGAAPDIGATEFDQAQCGAAHETPIREVPNDHLCQFGNPTGITTTPSAFTWQCQAGQNNASCAAPRQYLLNYWDGYNQAPKNIVTVTLVGGQTLPTTPRLARPGLSFVGWNTARDGSGDMYVAEADFTMPNSDVDMWAQWQLQGGCGTASGTPTVNKPTDNLCSIANAASEVTVTDGEFTWQCSGSAQICAAPRQYILSYDANGGNSAPASVAVIAGSATATAPAIMRDGFIFSGWNTQANGTGAHFEPESNINMPNSNVTLYAQWQPMAVLFQNGFE